MPVDGARNGRAWATLRTVIDALAYAGVVAGVTIALGLATGIALGGSVVLGKILLFVAGWLIVGIATLRLWPESPRQVALDDEAGAPTQSAARTGTTRMEGIANALPPLRWMRPPARKLSPPTKLFVAGLFVLLASYLLEVVFAVQ